MEKKELDSLLKQSLTPDKLADAGLDAAILERLEDSSFANQRQEKRQARQWSKGLVAKVAAIVLAVLALGAGTTYAAGRILGNVVIRETRLAVGDHAETWVAREQSIPLPEELPDIEVVEKVTGGAGDQWVEREEIQVDGSHTCNYTYLDYQTAVSDVGFPNVFTTILGTQESVTYQTVAYSIPGWESFQGGDMLYLCCNYGLGSYQLEQMPRAGEDPESAGICGFSVPMTHSGNVRSYVSANGTEFTLVDDLVQGSVLQKTVVMIDCEKMIGSVTFHGLTEEEIHQVLDTLDL